MQHTIVAPDTESVTRRVEAFKLSSDLGSEAIARFLPPRTDPNYLLTLNELIRADMEECLKRGISRRIEDYYWDFPELSAARSAAEFWQPTDLAATPVPIGHTAHTAIKPLSSGSADIDPTIDPRFPQVGMTFAGFRLVEELGQGGFGKVFLAEEPRLADRRVVLKITLKANNEPQRLARLQHTNIVPIQNAFQTGGLSAVQMPYYGRQTLADLIQYVRADGNPSQVGGKVFSTTVARQSTSRVPCVDKPAVPRGTTVLPPLVVNESNANEPHPIRDMLARMTYTDAIVWLITRIADGLAHAHARGILHLDIKPANVLFSDDGQPMLLDFNLGYDVCRQDRERVGGTWPYMAPEQIQEYAGEPGVSVDTRTDLYAIGILFFELLTCRQPFPPMARGPSGLASAVAARWATLPSVRKLNPTVPPAIESVICKLLDPDPAKRYQSAEDLQTDLERHQSNLPLKFAHNPSIRELAKKWQRRHPKAITHTLLSACLISMIGLGLAALNLNNNRSKERAIRTSTELNEALAHLRTDLVSPNDTELRRAAIKTGKDWLTRYGLPVDQKWADVPLVRDLPDDKRYATATALGELAALMAHAEMLDGQTTNTPVREAARRAAKWNRAAEQWFATANIPAIIWEQRAAIATTAEDLELAATIPEFRPSSNTTRTDLLLRAATHIASGEYALAIAPLTRLTDRENNLFAAHFWLAYCYQKTSKHLQALERYQMARALAPQDYRVPYNRGLVLLHLNRDHEAEDEFTQALKRNAQHADSYWHRALARRRLGDTRGAIDDLTYGMEIGVPRLSALLIRAELYRKLGDLAAESADRAAAENVQPQQEREFITRGLLRMRKDPLSALADFERAIELNPSSLTGWQNKGAVLSEYLGRTDEGLAATAKAVELHPEYGPVRMNLAVLLARLGHRSDAHREASRALMFSKDPQVIYQAANVYALTSASHPEDQEIALTYLRQAFQEKFDKFSLIDQDPDMANIRHLPAFSQAIQAARELHAK